MAADALVNVKDQHQTNVVGTKTSSVPYRIQHSCEYSGHLLKRSRWTVKWVFGLANVESLRSSRKVQGPESKGEEHEVRLVRFPRSRKARIYWNKRDITHLFGDANRKLNQLTFAWQARSGEIFRVTSTLGHGSRRNLQSDFFVDGQQFNNLVTWSELGQHHRNVASAAEESRCPSEDPQSRELEIHSSAIESEPDSGTVQDLGPEQEVAPANQNFRLSMVGLAPGPGDEVVDELRSDLYSPTIEVLRSQITQCIPQTEEMVSRAIINAFFSEDNESHASSDSLLSESTSDHSLGPIQLEVDAISQTYDWLRANQSLTRLAEQQEHKLEFLQTQIDAVMLEIRRDRLTATEACQMLLSVACVLGLDVNRLHENTTVLLIGLGKGATETELVSELKWYGEISAAAVSSDGSIGLCRFAYPASISLATEASDRKEIKICGDKAAVCGLPDAGKAFCLPLLNVVDETVRQREQAAAEQCPSPQFMMTEFSPIAASTGRLASVIVTPENGTRSSVKNKQVMRRTSGADRDCVSNKTVSTIATHDSEAGIYTPIIFSRGYE